MCWPQVDLTAVAELARTLGARFRELSYHPLPVGKDNDGNDDNVMDGGHASQHQPNEQSPLGALSSTSSSAGASVLAAALTSSNTLRGGAPSEADDARRLHESGGNALRRGELQEAVRGFREGAAAYEALVHSSVYGASYVREHAICRSNCAHVLGLLADASLREEEAAEAEGDVDEAIREQRHSLANEALLEAQRAVRIDHSYSKGHQRLAAALTRLGRDAESKEALAAVSSAQPTAAAVHGPRLRSFAGSESTDDQLFRHRGREKASGGSSDGGGHGGGGGGGGGSFAAARARAQQALPPLPPGSSLSPEELAALASCESLVRAAHPAPRLSGSAGGLDSSYYYAAVGASERQLPVDGPQRIPSRTGSAEAAVHDLSGPTYVAAVAAESNGGASVGAGQPVAAGSIREDIARKGEGSYYYAHDRKADFLVPTVPKRLHPDGSMTPWDGS